jgi:hypothetical protein
MKVRAVDERDIRWEQDSPTFRVLFTHTETGATSAFDVDDASHSKCREWATHNTPDGAEASIGVKATDELGHLGLIWID